MTNKITAVYAEESHLFDNRLLISTVYEDGTIEEKHLWGSVAKRYLKSQRAKIGK